MRQSLRFWGHLAFVLAALTFASSASAQDATLSGVVTDSTDAVMPGVTVTAVQTDTGNTYTAVSEGNGSYRISAIRPGTYKVTVELQGFATLTQDNLNLLVGQNAQLNFKLTPANLSESVTVSGEAPL